MWYHDTMEQELKTMLERQEAKIDAIQKSVEQSRRYFLATLIVTGVVFVLPLIAMVFVVPFAIDTLTSAYAI